MPTTNAACKVAAAPQPIIANDDDASTDRGKIEIKDAMKRSLELGEPVVIRTAISPETAGWLLGNNADNRNQSETKYFQYADDMRSGRWMENGDGIGDLQVQFAEQRPEPLPRCPDLRYHDHDQRHGRPRARSARDQ